MKGRDRSSVVGAESVSICLSWPSVPLPTIDMGTFLVGGGHGPWRLSAQSAFVQSVCPSPPERLCSTSCAYEPSGPPLRFPHTHPSLAQPPGVDGEVRTPFCLHPLPQIRVSGARPVPRLPVFAFWEGVHGSLWGLQDILRAHRLASPLCPQSPPRSPTQVSRNPRRPGVSDEAGRGRSSTGHRAHRVSDGCWGAGLERAPHKKERTSGSRDLWGLGAN